MYEKADCWEFSAYLRPESDKNHVLVGGPIPQDSDVLNITMTSCGECQEIITRHGGRNSQKANCLGLPACRVHRGERTGKQITLFIPQTSHFLILSTSLPTFLCKDGGCLWSLRRMGSQRRSESRTYLGRLSSSRISSPSPFRGNDVHLQNKP